MAAVDSAMRNRMRMWFISDPFWMMEEAISADWVMDWLGVRMRSEGRPVEINSNEIQWGKFGKKKNFVEDGRLDRVGSSWSSCQRLRRRVMAHTRELSRQIPSTWKLWCKNLVEDGHRINSAAWILKISRILPDFWSSFRRMALAALRATVVEMDSAAWRFLWVNSRWNVDDLKMYSRHFRSVQLDGVAGADETDGGPSLQEFRILKKGTLLKTPMATRPGKTTGF